MMKEKRRPGTKQPLQQGGRKRKVFCVFASSLHGLLNVCTTIKLGFMFTPAHSVSVLLALKESWGRTARLPAKHPPEHMSSWLKTPCGAHWYLHVPGCRLSSQGGEALGWEAHCRAGRLQGWESISAGQVTPPGALTWTITSSGSPTLHGRAMSSIVLELPERCG